MHQVQLELTDQVNQQIKRRADAAGYSNVNEYVTDVLTSEDDADNLDHLFTPERIAHIDKVYAEVNAGGPTYTMEEVSAYLAEKRAEWIRRSEK